ncbi:MAG: hypothetical protein V1681_02190 [Candidatus Neomarinimicrobiota bacterium]
MRLVRFWMIVIFAVGMAFESVAPVAAQTQNEINGFIWKKMKRDNKYYWLLGYLQGLEKADEIIKSGVTDQKKREFNFTEPFYINQMHTRIGAYFPPERIEGVDQLIEILNAFYEDKFNQRIKIEAALRIVLARQQGQVEQADFWLNEARRAFLQK